ncbi:Hypothetical protein MVR_LOCUS48 [uncultured virus]|nr:Hypothetical protein MVR_LOCUS48 [uncultured virus]
MRADIKEVFDREEPDAVIGVLCESTSMYEDYPLATIIEVRVSSCQGSTTISVYVQS